MPDANAHGGRRSPNSCQRRPSFWIQDHFVSDCTLVRNCTRRRQTRSTCARGAGTTRSTRPRAITAEIITSFIEQLDRPPEVIEDLTITSLVVRFSAPAD